MSDEPKPTGAVTPRSHGATYYHGNGTHTAVVIPPKWVKVNWGTLADYADEPIPVVPLHRDPAGVRQAKRVAKDRARKKAAKKHKQHMRRSGKQ